MWFISLSHSLPLSLLPLFRLVAGWWLILLPCLSVLLCVSISTGLSCLLSASLSLSVSLYVSPCVGSLVCCLSLLPSSWKSGVEKTVKLFGVPLLVLSGGLLSCSLFLSVSCFLPVYLSPPSHMHKSKTHQQLSPPTHLPFSLPLLVFLSSSPPCRPSSFLSFAPLQNILNTKATPRFPLSHSSSSSPSPLFLAALSSHPTLALSLALSLFSFCRFPLSW